MRDTLPYRRKIPELGSQLKLKLKNPEVITLDNGVKVYNIEGDNYEFTRLDFVFSAGSSFQNKSLVAESTLQLLQEGTRNNTSNEIAYKFDYYGALIDVNLTKDRSSISVYCLNKFIAELVPLIKEIITQPSFEQHEIENYFSRKKHKFNLNIKKVKFEASLKFNENIFGEKSRYGMTKSANDFDIIDRTDLTTFFKNFYHNRLNYITLSGKITSENTKIINDYFGRDKNFDNKSNNFTFVSKTPITGFLYFNRPKSLQTAFRIGGRAIDKKNSDYAGMVVLNTILGGYFGSRLMTNLREKNGFTYGVSSFIINYLHSGYWCIATEVISQKSDEALKEIYYEIDKLRTEKVNIDELNLVKNYIYGTYLRSFDGPLAQTDRLRSSLDLNFNFNSYSENLQKMMSVTPSEIIEIANKYYKLSDLTNVVVGTFDRNKFE